MFVIAQPWQGGFRYWQQYDKATGDLFVYPVHIDHARRFDTREEAEEEAEYIAFAEVHEV
jgi:hypothetical protein